MLAIRFTLYRVVSLCVAAAGLPLLSTSAVTFPSQRSSSRYPGVALKYWPEEGDRRRIA